jgi:hypothetical protein
MRSRLGLSVLFFSLLLFAFSTAGASAASVADPAGDVLACTGECSNYDQDLKSLIVAANGANLEVTVEQFGTGGSGPFTSACGYYWPIIEIFTASADPAGPPTGSFFARVADFAIGSFNCLASPGGIGHKLVVPPTVPGPSTVSLAVVTTTNPDLNTVTYSVPLAAVGGTVAGLRVRAWQTSASPPGAVDVVPDTGTLLAGASVPAGGGGGGVNPLPNLNKLPKSAILNTSFSSKLDFAAPADSVDLTLATGGTSAAQAAKVKIVGKKTLKHVGPGLVKFSIPISKSFRKGIKEGKKVKLIFKAVVHAPGMPATTISKKITFKKKS